MIELMRPKWPAPSHVHGFSTLRTGGSSVGVWAASNLGDHVGDQPQHVACNRAQLRQQLPSNPVWLRQIHSAAVADLDAPAPALEADAAVTRTAGVVCTVLTADCLPVLFCDRSGTVVGAAHAGWKGLAAGVLEATICAMHVPPSEILAWLGPAIGPAAFEVGNEVRDVFITTDHQAATAFIPRGEKWLADLYRLARLRLAAAGVHTVYGGGLCTFTDRTRYFSYRRDGVTGRMAHGIWIAHPLR